MVSDGTWSARNDETPWMLWAPLRHSRTWQRRNTRETFRGALLRFSDQINIFDPPAETFSVVRSYGLDRSSKSSIPGDDCEIDGPPKSRNEQTFARRKATFGCIPDFGHCGG